MIGRQHSHLCHTTHHASLQRWPLWALYLTAAPSDMSFLCGKFKEKTKTKIQTLIISDFCTVTSYKLKKKTLELLQAHLCDLILSFNFFILITPQNITNHFYARLTVILKTRFCFVAKLKGFVLLLHKPVHHYTTAMHTVDMFQVWGVFCCCCF